MWTSFLYFTHKSIDFESKQVHEKHRRVNPWPMHKQVSSKVCETIMLSTDKVKAKQNYLYYI